MLPLQEKHNPVHVQQRHFCQLRQPAVLIGQRGISLLTVFTLLLFTALLVLGTMRMGIFNESMVGNQADQQRAYAAAEALMQHAANDVYNNGPHCPASQSVCRYPRNHEDFNHLTQNLLGKCGTGDADSDTPKGVCIPATPDDRVFQVDYILKKPQGQTADVQMSANSALDYANFASTAKPGNADLTLGSSKGQYWVEIFRYNTIASGQFNTSALPIPDNTYPYIYRITVRAQGLKQGTVSILRSFYVPVPRKPL